MIEWLQSLTWDEWDDFATIIRNFALVIGVIGAAVALWFNYQRTQNDRRRLANDTFVKAVEQLGSEEMNVRLGAIYALERIAIEEERYHWPIMETLCAYVRERAPWPPKDDSEQAMAEALRGTFGTVDENAPLDPNQTTAEDGADNSPKRAPTDIQTVLTVIGRRSKKRRSVKRPWLEPFRRWCQEQTVTKFSRQIWGEMAPREGVGTLGLPLTRPFWKFIIKIGIRRPPIREPSRLSLCNSDLRYIDFSSGYYHGIFLLNSNLAGATLNNANFEFSDMSEAQFISEGQIPKKTEMIRTKFRRSNFENANLKGADAWEADFTGAIMHGTKFVRAQCQYARFVGVHLHDAKLMGAYFNRAVLRGVSFGNSDLWLAKFTGANLKQADLRFSYLGESELSGACLEGARFSKEPNELGAIWDKDNAPTGKYIVEE